MCLRTLPLLQIVLLLFVLDHSKYRNVIATIVSWVTFNYDPMRSEISKSLVVSSSGDKMTSSPAEMRTTPKRAKSQTKADADKERLPQRHRSREHQQVPTAATPTRATNLRLRAWVDDADNERLPLRHRIPACLGGRR